MKRLVLVGQLILVISLFLCSLISCDDDISPNVRLDKELVLQLNTKSTDTLVIASGTYILDAYLWRDFMPISPIDGKPLISINWLINLDSVSIPDNIGLIKQYVIFQDYVWTSDYTNESTSYQPSYKIQRVSREGPKWGPKIFVDVISQIHDSYSNEDYYIKRKNVYIERTD